MSGRAATGTVCVDIGGTAVKSGLWENGRLVDLHSIPTPAEGGEAVVRLVADIAAGYPGAGRLGVSSTGEVDVERGAIRASDNIPGYTGLPVRGMLQAITGLPVALENDVNAAALGEMAAGAARGLESFIMACYGTGVGGAVVVDGRLLRGAHQSAGEVGGLITHPEAVTESQVGSGSYEQYAATTALVRRTRTLSPELDSGLAVFEALEDETVRMLLHRWIDEICYGLVGAIHLLDPEAVVLGGAIMQEAYVLERLRQRLIPMLKPGFRAVQLLTAELGNRAGLYGAGLLADTL